MLSGNNLIGCIAEAKDILHQQAIILRFSKCESNPEEKALSGRLSK